MAEGRREITTYTKPAVWWNRKFTHPVVHPLIHPSIQPSIQPASQPFPSMCPTLCSQEYVSMWKPWHLTSGNLSAGQDQMRAPIFQSWQPPSSSSLCFTPNRAEAVSCSAWTPAPSTRAWPARWNEWTVEREDNLGVSSQAQEGLLALSCQDILPQTWTSSLPLLPLLLWFLLPSLVPSRMTQGR